MKLITISCQAEDFIAEVETFGQVRHKNLVKLLGYCIEGTYRYQVLIFLLNKWGAFLFLTSVL
jgi:hypothetical protein